MAARRNEPAAPIAKTVAVTFNGNRRVRYQKIRTLQVGHARKMHVQRRIIGVICGNSKLSSQPRWIRMDHATGRACLVATVLQDGQTKRNGCTPTPSCAILASISSYRRLSYRACSASYSCSVI